MAHPGDHWLGDIGALYKYAVVSYEFLASLFPAIIIGIVWKRGNAIASWASIIGGSIVCGILQIWPDLQATFGGFGAGFTGAVVAVILYVVIGFASPEDERVAGLFVEVENYKEA